MTVLLWVIEATLWLSVVSHVTYAMTLRERGHTGRQILAWDFIVITWVLFAASLAALILQLHGIYGVRLNG